MDEDDHDNHQNKDATRRDKVIRYTHVTYPACIGLYRDVWSAAIASSRKSLTTLSVVMCNVTMKITFVTRKFRNGQRNVHCDVVRIPTKWVFGLTLDCNGVFAIKAYG